MGSNKGNVGEMLEDLGNASDVPNETTETPTPAVEQKKLGFFASVINTLKNIF